MLRFLALTPALALLAGARADDAPLYRPDYDGGKEFRYEEPVPLPGINEHDDNMTCSRTERAGYLDARIRGVNLGGFLVLEPWITPSLFYQFLGATERYGDDAPAHTGMDMYTFCAALGAEEANRQLRRHWQAWVTDDDLARLAELEIDTLRVPVGDWMWDPYGPYENCTAGARDELRRVADAAHRYNLKIVLDLHGVRGSQNGLDNSGMSHRVVWTSVASKSATGVATFEHWPRRTAEWMGTWDVSQFAYTSLDWDNLRRTLQVVEAIVEEYKGHPAIMGFEPVNEPWQFTPLGPLKRYYWEAYKVVKRRAPRWAFFIHDSFRLSPEIWGGFMHGCPGVVMDTHQYHAWTPPQTTAPVVQYAKAACALRKTLNAYEALGFPVVVGEWSLATDNCAMWLNGFNDNLPGYPMVPCGYVPCPKPYMGPDQPGAPPQRNVAPQGPWGSGPSTPLFGMCPVSPPWPDGADDEVLSALAAKQLEAFSYGHGFFFWNFKTELDPRWDYMRAAEAGWMPGTARAAEDALQGACDAEERGAYVCECQESAPREDIMDALGYACQMADESNGALDIPECRDGSFGPELQGAKLVRVATDVYNRFWHARRAAGATCDFGGTARLMEESRAGPHAHLGPEESAGAALSRAGPGAGPAAGMAPLEEDPSPAEAVVDTPVSSASRGFALNMITLLIAGGGIVAVAAAVALAFVWTAQQHVRAHAYGVHASLLELDAEGDGLRSRGGGEPSHPGGQ